MSTSYSYNYMYNKQLNIFYIIGNNEDINMTLNYPKMLKRFSYYNMGI